jgi:hypothetical protein
MYKADCAVLVGLDGQGHVECSLGDAHRGSLEAVDAVGGRAEKMFEGDDAMRDFVVGIEGTRYGHQPDSAEALGAQLARRGDGVDHVLGRCVLCDRVGDCACAGVWRWRWRRF